jgi:hypothetical protein
LAKVSPRPRVRQNATKSDDQVQKFTMRTRSPGLLAPK